MDFQKTVISNTEPDRKAKVWARPTKEGVDLLILDAGKWKPVMSEEIIREIMEDIGTATEVIKGETPEYYDMKYGKMYFDKVDNAIFVPINEPEDSTYKVLEFTEDGLFLNEKDGSSNQRTKLSPRLTDLTPEERASLKGDKGDQGDSAVYDPSSPDAPDFVMANTTGQSTTKAMTQKAVTNSIQFGVDEILDITPSSTTNTGYYCYGLYRKGSVVYYNFNGTATDANFNYDIYVQYEGDEEGTKIEENKTDLLSSIAFVENATCVYFYIRKSAGLSALHIRTSDSATVKSSIKDLQDRTFVDKSTDVSSWLEWNRGNGLPGAAAFGKWLVDSYTRSHYYKKREPSMKYIKVTSNSTVRSRIIFSTNYTAPVNNASFGQIGDGATVPLGGNTATIPIPDTCEYIMVWHENRTTDYTPSSVSFGYDTIKVLEEDVEEIKSDTLVDIPSNVLDWNVGDGHPGTASIDEWAVPANMNRTHLWMKRDASMKYITVTANSNMRSELRFSTDHNPVDGQKYGFISSLTTPAGEIRKAKIPDNCEYLLLFRTSKSPSANYMPEKIVITKDVGNVAKNLEDTVHDGSKMVPYAKSILMPEDFEGNTLSAKVIALNTFIKSLPDSMEKVVYFGKNDEYEFTQAFEIPSNTSVILENCVVHLAADTVDNVFRSANLIPDPDNPLHVAKEMTGTLQNLRIIGKNATIKTIWTGDQTYGVGEFGWRGILIVFSFVEGYEVAGLKTDNSLDWQFSFAPCCNYGKIHDLELNTYRHESNGDGINVQGHDVSIYNISGRTEDDTIALGTVDEYRTVLHPSEEDVSPFPVTPNASFGDTYNVHICNVHCSGENHIVAFVPGGYGKTHDIYISDVSDEYNESYSKLAVIKFYDGSYNGHYTDGDIYNIVVNGLEAKFAPYAIKVVGMPHDSSFNNIGYASSGIKNDSDITFEAANTAVTNIAQGLTSNVSKNILESIRGKIAECNASKSANPIATVSKNLYKIDFSELEDVTLGTWTNEGDHLESTGTGHSNSIVFDRQYCIDTKTHVYDFEVTSGSSICFGNDVMSADGQSASEANDKLVVDFANQEISISHTISPTYEYTKAFSFSSYDGVRFRLIVTRKGRKVTATLINLKDLSVIVELSTTTWATDKIFFWEKPIIYAVSGSISLYNFLVNCDVNPAGVHLYVVGDSITEGDKMADNATRWTTLLQNDFPEGSVVVSGRASATIFHVLERLESEAAVLHPKYVMVTIGTNGQNTTQLLTQAVTKIQQIGAIPILNRVPCQNGGGHTTYNAAVNSVVEELGLLSCRFDIATAINYNLSSGCDTSLFFDGTHPNAAGCKRMYNRIKIDIPELFN